MNRSHYAVLVLLLTLATSAFSSTYYVATPANGGNNANSGSISSPWATITYGFGRLSPGDTLYVRGGTYNETLTVWNKCDSLARWYTVQEYPGETAIIDGAGKTGNGVIVIGGGTGTPSCYVRINGFEVKNGGVHGIFLYDAHHIDILNNNVHDNTERGISVSSASGSAFGTTHHVLVQGNAVHHNVKQNQSLSASSWQQGLSTLRADEIDIINNDVYENWGEGLDIILSDHADVLQNRVSDNFSVNIYLDNAQYTTVDRNLVRDGIASTPSNYYRGGESAHGIYIANETYSAGQNACTNLTITNNIVLKTNLGIAYANYEYGGGLHNTLIANNTVVQTDDLLYWVDNGTTNVHDTTTVENNIFYAKTGQNYAYANSAGITYASNCWWNGVSSTRKTSSSDINADPEFTNLGGTADTDYRLQSTSDCINAGTTISTLLTDYFGTSRSGVFDIGAHEYTP